MATTNPPAPQASPGSFPVALGLTQKPCLLVGSSEEMTARARDLLAAGAILRVVSEQPSPALQELARRGDLELLIRPFESDDLNGRWLVVLTDRSQELSTFIGSQCESRCIFFCAIDQPTVSTFSHVAVARAGQLWAAFGSTGAAPALASRLRKELQRLFDESNFARVVDNLIALRARTVPERRREVMLAVASAIAIEGRIAVGASAWRDE